MLEYLQNSHSLVQGTWFFVALVLVTLNVIQKSTRVLAVTLLAIYESQHAYDFSLFSYCILVLTLLDYQISTTGSLFAFKNKNAVIIALMFTAMTVTILSTALGQSNTLMHAALPLIIFSCFLYLENPWNYNALKVQHKLETDKPM